MPAAPRLALSALDDTLADRWQAHRRRAAEFAAAHSMGDKAVTWLVFAAAPHIDSMEPFFTAAREQFALMETATHLRDQCRRRIPELTTCPTPVTIALGRIRRAGWRIGIVASGASGFQLAKIRATRLDHLTGAWCVSGEAGTSEPGPAMFRLAAARCRSSRTLHVRGTGCAASSRCR